MVQKLSSKTMIGISCGYFNACAIANDGSIYQCGRFANDTLVHSNKFVKLEKMYGNKYVSSVSCGDTHMVTVVDNILSNYLTVLQRASPENENFLNEESKVKASLQIAAAHAPHLVNPIQNRVMRECYKKFKKPSIECSATYLKFSMREGLTKSAQLLKVTNTSEYPITVGIEVATKQKVKDLHTKIMPAMAELVKGETKNFLIEVNYSSVLEDKNSFQINVTVSNLKVSSISCFFLLAEVLPQGNKKGERDKELVSLLVNCMATYLPRYIVDNLKYPLKPSATPFPAAILFLDISGFTALNEKLSILGSGGPEQLSKHLNSYFGKLIEVVTSNGGDVLKFAGDALICMFGDPSEKLPIDELTQRAVETGKQEFWS